ncbi:MAG: hypothetical protein IJV64_04155 [Oscillospiraceae bacterium]|nr:hypothetical protein [Oscillospiraceae bacterium]
MTKRSVQKEIDKAVKSIWLNEICAEYGKGNFILEASVQCSLYHHLRNMLDALLHENSLYIYPEYYFSDLRYYADLAICQMDMSRDTRLHDKLTDVYAIIEIKYGGSSDYIKTDLPKFKTYMQSLDYDCQYYFAAIDELTERDRLRWLDGRSIGKWANGRFTELNAGWIDGTMRFEVNSYNGMNTQNKTTVCNLMW